MVEKERLWNDREVVDFLGIGYSTLQLWKRNRKIPFIKIGKLTKYVPSEIRNWLETNRVCEINVQ